MDRNSPQESEDADASASFSCDHPGCTVKSFPTRSHLNRHLGIHTGATRRECPSCGKVFARSDVLIRHRTRAHAFRSTGSDTGRAKSQRRTRTPGTAENVNNHCETPQQSVTGSEIESTQPINEVENDFTHLLFNMGSPYLPKDTQEEFLPQSQARGNETLFSQIDSVQTNTNQTSAWPPLTVPQDLRNSEHASGSRTNTGGTSTFADAATSVLGGAQGQAQGVQVPGPWQSIDATISSMPLSHGFDFTDDFWGVQFPFGSATEVQPSLPGMVDVNYLMTTSTVTSPNATYDWLALISNDYLPSSTTASNCMHGSAHASIQNAADTSGNNRVGGDAASTSAWPHTWNPAEAANEINVNAIISPDQASGLALIASAIPAFHRLHVSEAQRSEIIDITVECSKSIYGDIGREELHRIFPSAQVLSGCLILYFRHFSSTLPLLRPKVFSARSAPPVLILTMAAIGAVFSREYLNDVALALNELARRLLIYLNERDNRTMFQLPVLQAHLLQSLGGFFSGSRRLYMYAELARSHLVTATRRMHLLRRAPRIDLQPGEDSSDIFWEEEERRRVGWAVYYFDSLLSTIINGQPLFSLAEIKVPLPCSDEAWESESRTVAPMPAPTFPEVMNTLLTSQRLPGVLSSFGYLVTGQSLYRMCLDAHTLQSLTYRPFASKEEYRLKTEASYSASPQTLLKRVVDVWLFISDQRSAAFMTITALSHHAHIHFAFPGLLEMIKAAGGKPSTEGVSPKESARQWLPRWIDAYPVSARRAMVHAAQMLDSYAGDNDHSGPAEVILAFDATLTIWAICKYGPTDRWSKEDLTAPLSLQAFIQSGGTVDLPGYGRLKQISLVQFLEAAVAKLAPIAWGLSKTFQQVLHLLIQEEKLLKQ